MEAVPLHELNQDSHIPKKTIDIDQSTWQGAEDVKSSTVEQKELKVLKSKKLCRKRLRCRCPFITVLKNQTISKC